MKMTMTWSRWVHWANIGVDIKLMDGTQAQMLGVKRFSGKVRIIRYGRHETIMPQDIALVFEPGEYEATWVRPEPWTLEDRPDWHGDVQFSGPSLTVAHDPTALHPSFLPPADQATKELDVSSLRLPVITLDNDDSF